jgi:hypothetical protein
MDELELDIRGRQVAMETLVLTLLVHVAATTNDPARFASTVMKNGELNLRHTREGIQDPDEAKVIDYALGNFGHMTEVVLAFVKEIRRPAAH